MTDFEQFIYNCYLETSRKANNQPFRYRKDFTDFDKKEEYLYVCRLSKFFSKFPNINVKDFFKAPYAIYNEKYFDMQYFTTQKAVKAYTIYQTKFLLEDPDNKEVLEKIKDSYVFIYNYCKQNKITFNEYTSNIEPVRKWHEFLLHLKYREISIYALFEFTNFDKVVQSYDREIKQFAFGETLHNINLYRTKYYSSSKAKKMCQELFSKLNSKLQSL